MGRSRIINRRQTTAVRPRPTVDRANYETTIADLMTGQQSDPLRVTMFNTDTDRAEDVSHAIAQEILRRLGPPWSYGVPPASSNHAPAVEGGPATVRRGW